MKKPTMALVLGLALLTVAGGALAMVSPGYRLEWMEPLTGSGGPRMASAGYAADVTAGQVGFEGMSSATYRVALGYWAGIRPVNRVYLPLVLRG